MTFWNDVGDPLCLSMHLTNCLYCVSFRRYRPLKLPSSCKVVQKRWFLGPRFVGGGGIPDVGHAFSNYTQFRPCGRFSLSFVQRPRKLEGEKKKERKKERKKKEETLVEYKSVDILCRAA